MVFVTGDTHGELHRDKLGVERWPEGQRLTRDDYVVVCGDFGSVFGPSKRDEKILDWWESQPWTTLFVDGNHENHDVLHDMASEKRFDGQVHAIPGYPHVIHLMRGCVFDLPLSASETVSALVMGGARSTDRMGRTEGVDWWAREMPTEEEYDRCDASLEARGWKVDYVITHELPADLRIRALGWQSYAELASSADPLSNYLQWVYDSLDKNVLRCWYAGHYHVDETVGDKVRVLFEDIVALGGTEAGR